MRKKKFISRIVKVEKSDKIGVRVGVPAIVRIK